MRMVVCLMGALVLAGCKKEQAKPAATGNSQSTSAPAPLLPIGTADPFARLSPDAQKALSHAKKALHAKKWDEAETELQKVIAAAPDHTAARWSLLRALVAQNKLGDAAKEVEQLYARDFAAVAPKLASAKELAPLRASPEWSRLQALAPRYREAWTRGLDKGFFLVARRATAAEPKLADDTKEAALDLQQEVYFYGVDEQRFRRITDTDGHAFAIARAGKLLAVLIAPRLHRENQLDSFVDPKVGAVDLSSLEMIGPFTMKGQYDQVSLAADGAGNPLYSFTVTTGATTTYAIDTARTGLAPMKGVVPVGDETRAWPNQVAHVSARGNDGVRITDGENQLVIEAAPQVTQPITVTSARPIAQSSLDWSPAKQKLTYAGKLDACRILKSGTTIKDDKNELFVYDVSRRAAQRVSAAVSQFETLWLDDDRLVYEGGVGKDGQIHLYAFSAHADSVLPTRHGAGLYGVPTLACEQAETGVDEDLGDAPDEGD